MEYKNIIIEKKEHICVLIINHPPANTWNLSTLEEFEHALNDLENDKNIRVIIITGSGDKCFSAGFDVTDAANAEITAQKGHSLWRRVDRFEKPIIAAINGYALGGGCELALACHFRAMADFPKAQIGLTELNLGIIPGWGGTQYMTRQIGRSKALDLILFSKKIDASEALRIGLVDKVSTPDELMNGALELAALLAKRPPIAVSCILKAIAAGIYEGIDEGLKVELESVSLLRKTNDAREGILAFLEKRPPEFKGE
jgi:enoyl-CoA hydratase/carnithine racemase